MDNTDDITIENQRISPAEYIDFLKRSDLGKQYPKEDFNERIATLLKNIQISLVARSPDGTIVGVCFGITDFAYWLFITDLGVDRQFTHQGIGRKMVQLCHTMAGGQDRIIMFTNVDANAEMFYNRLGFVKASNAMELSKIKWTSFTVD